MVREGGSAGAIGVILAGRATTTIAGRSAVPSLLPGDGFGEIAILHPSRGVATVTAAEHLRTRRIDGDALPAPSPP